MIKQTLVDRIERKYNPENDMPEGVQVTWVDMCLLEIIQAQQEQIEKLERKITELDSSVQDKGEIIRNLLNQIF